MFGAPKNTYSQGFYYRDSHIEPYVQIEYGPTIHDVDCNSYHAVAILGNCGTTTLIHKYVYTYTYGPTMHKIILHHITIL